MNAVTVFAHLTMRCNAKCGFCFQTRDTDVCLSIKTLESWLELLKPKHLVFLGGEPTLLALPNSKPSLMEYVKTAKSYDCKLTLETNGKLLVYEPQIMEPLYDIFDYVSISLDYLTPRVNMEVGRWDRDILQQLMNIASERHNVSFTSVYLGGNLGDILMLAEWSILNDKPYLVKCDKSMGVNMGSGDAIRNITILYRYLYMLLKTYNLNPYKSNVMVEEPQWITYLNLQTGYNASTGCSAGSKIFSILPNGALTPCPLGAMFYYIIAKSPEYEIQNIKTLNITGCSSCIYHIRYGCTGCPAFSGGSAKICPLYKPAQQTEVRQEVKQTV